MRSAFYFATTLQKIDDLKHLSLIFGEKLLW